jgi:hypothetical protein
METGALTPALRSRLTVSILVIRATISPEAAACPTCGGAMAALGGDGTWLSCVASLTAVSVRDCVAPREGPRYLSGGEREAPVFILCTTIVAAKAVGHTTTVPSARRSHDGEPVIGTDRRVLNGFRWVDDDPVERSGQDLPSGDRA